MGALVAAAIASEIALGKRKLQIGLSKVLVVWTVVYLALMFLLFRHTDIGMVSITIFWGGAFLSWFGIRSHLES